MSAHKFLGRLGLPFLLLIGGLHLSAHADAGDDICFPLYAKGGAVPGTGLACKLAASSIPVGLGTYFCTGGTDRIDRYCNGTPPPVAGSGNPPEPAGGMCKAGESVGHPILPATAEKYRSELDWADAGPDALAMRRIYRSNRGTDPARVPGVMGKTWTHSYSTHLTGTPVVAPTAVSVTSPEGYVRSFTRAAGASSWSASNNADSLTQAADGGWTYRRADDDATLQFGADGKLLTQSDRSGRLTTYSYNAAGQLSSVRNAFGRTLGFAYTGALLTSVNTPDGRTIAYGYDTDGRLVSVTYPDGTSRRFAYENAAFANVLTGLIDETGARYASFSYDALGRAVSTELAGATERYQVAYGTAAEAAPAPATVVDPLGTTRVYQYGTANGKLAVLGATLASGSGAEDASSRTQDANGLVTSETDFRGVRTDTTWDVARRLPTSVTEAVGTPEQRTTTIQWHPTLSLPVRITEPGRSTAFTYDAQGNLTKKTVTDTLATPPEARTWKWTYTAQALVETETAPNGAVTRYTYDAAGNMRTATNALGHVTTYAYDSANRIVSITAPTGLVTTNTWDARGRLLSQAVTGMPATELTYNPTGTLATLRLPTGLQMSYIYDGAHRLTGWSNNRGESGSFTLDGMGNRTAEQIKDASGTVVWNALRSVNAINRVAAQTEGQSQSSTFGYDANGDRTSETNGLNQTTRYAMDALRRLSTITDPQSASASLGYNALDGVVQAKDFKSTATSYTRDALGNATSEASPDSGMASTTYDRLGLPQTVVDAMGRATHITRDLLGRPTQLSYADGTQSTLLYDLPGRKFNAEGAPLASVGYLSEVQDAGVDTRFVRDLWGRVIRKTQTLADGQVRELAYRFRRGERHGAGLVRVIRYPSGKKLRHLYDATGRLTGLEWDGQPLLTHITWNPLGQPTGWSWPGFMRAPGDPAPLAEQRSYTDAGQLARSALLHITRDAAGRISHITQQQQLPTDSNTLAQEVALSSAYTYDSTGRLTASAHSAAGVALPTGWSLSDTIGPDSVGYAYDANGNRTQASYRITTPAGTDTLERSSAIASGSNRIGSRTDVYTPAGGTAPSTTTTTAYPYDSAGELTRHLDAYLFYDAQGRIAQASTRSNPQARHAVRYTYNSAGQRIEKTDARLSPAHPITEETVYAEDQPGSTILGQYANRRSTDSAAPAGQMDSTEVIYLPTASGPMPVAAEINGRLYAIHSDQLNTPRRLTNQQGQVAWQWLISGFGEVPPTSGATGYALNGIPGSRVYSEAVRFDLRYPGQVWDEETGLAYNLHRYYDAQLGRYVQSDPIGLGGGGIGTGMWGGIQFNS